MCKGFVSSIILYYINMHVKRSKFRIKKIYCSQFLSPLEIDPVLKRDTPKKKKQKSTDMRPRSFKKTSLWPLKFLSCDSIFRQHYPNQNECSSLPNTEKSDRAEGRMARCYRRVRSEISRSLNTQPLFAKIYVLYKLLISSIRNRTD